MSKTAHVINEESSKALLQAVAAYFRFYPPGLYGTVANFYTNPPIFKATIIRNEKPKSK